MVVGVTVSNVLVYAYAVVAAHVLGPHQYGAVAALLGLVLVAAVLCLGLMATGARRVAGDPGRRHEVEREVMRVAWFSGVALAVVLLVFAPVLQHLLRLDGVAPAALVAIYAVPLTLYGAQVGILQGERLWTSVALVFLGVGLGRLVLGTAFILWRPSQTSAMLGVTVGALVPVVVGEIALRRHRSPADALPPSDRHSTRAILVETAHNSQALLAFLALSNVDVLVARNALDSRLAGLYAAGAILAKALLFLPQFVNVVAFPGLSSSASTRDTLARSLVGVSAMGALGVLATVLLPGIALVFVGGSTYVGVIDELWLFAVLGTVLALLQLLVYAALARGRRWSVLWVWVAFATIVVLGSTCSTVGGLLAVVLTTDAVLLLVMLTLALRHHDQRTPAGLSPP